MANNGIQKIAANTKTCVPIEFSAVLLKLDEQSSHSRDVRRGLAPAAISNSRDSAAARYNSDPARWGDPGSPFESSIPLPLKTILRI
jgi:hypothetical protein